MLFAKAYDLIFANGMALFENNNGFDLLAPLFIGNTDDSDIGYSFHLKNNVLDFRGVDVCAATHDHIPGPIQKVVIPVIIHASHVAGGCPFMIKV